MSVLPDTTLLLRLSEAAHECRVVPQVSSDSIAAVKGIFTKLNDAVVMKSGRNAVTTLRGFTLVEMSIVLVIIALVAGGVLAGRELIHQSNLRRIITDIEMIKTATTIYKLKYNAMPGDDPKASMKFPGLVNGNGDGMVVGNEGDDVWKHLIAAKLVTHLVREDNVYFLETSLKNNGGYWVAFNWISRSGRHEIFYSLPGAAWRGPSVSPAEGKTIDLKTDDGIPTTGSTRGTTAVGQAWSNCLAAYDGADWAAGKSIPACYMWFLY